MRRSLGLALRLLALLVVAAGLYWQARGTSERAPEDESPPAVSTSPQPAIVLTNELEQPSENSAPRALESQLRGTIVDRHGVALARARVWISSPGDDWALGIVPPPIDVLGKQVRAFEARTRDDGGFELRVPTPSAARLRLDIVSADHRGRTAREYTSSTRAAADAIAPGPNELGTIEIELQSSIAGVVRSRAGAPIAQATVTRRRGHGHGGYERTRTDSAGHYALSADAGEYDFQIEASGHLTLHAAPVVVAPDSARSDVDFVLVPTPTLAGRVVGSGGGPVAGVRVCAAGVDDDGVSRRESSTESAADGTFVIALQSEQRHWLWTDSFKLDNWKSWTTGTRDFAAGSSGIEIQVASRVVTRVRPQNALTHEPIDVLGLELLDDEPPWKRRDDDDRERRRTVPHAWPCARNGRDVELDATPQRALAWAPGYAPRELRLSGSAEEILPLQPLGGLSGAFVREGVPCSTAALIVRRVEAGGPPRAFWSEVPSPNAEEAVREESQPLRQVPRRVHADARGAFCVTHLQPGEYEVAILEDGRRWIDPLPRSVVVPSGTVLDLGRVSLARDRADLRIRMVLANQAAPRLVGQALRATINGQPLALAIASTNECRALPAGTVVVEFAAEAPLLGEPRRWSIDVTPGAKLELTVDLSDIDLCMLHASLAPDSPRRFTRKVYLRAADARPGTGVEIRTSSFATDDSSGTLLRGGSRYLIEARDSAGTVLTTSEIEAPRSGHFELAFRAP